MCNVDKLAKILKVSSVAPVTLADGAAYGFGKYSNAEWRLDLPEYVSPAGPVRYQPDTLRRALQAAGKGATLDGYTLRTVAGGAVPLGAGEPVDGVTTGWVEACPNAIAGTQFARLADVAFAGEGRDNLAQVWLDAGHAVATNAQRMRVELVTVGGVARGVPVELAGFVTKRDQVCVGAHTASAGGVTFRTGAGFVEWRRVVESACNNATIALPELPELPAAALRKGSELVCTFTPGDGWRITNGAAGTVNVHKPGGDGPAVRFRVDPRYYADLQAGAVRYYHETAPIVTDIAPGVYIITMPHRV